MGAAAPANLQIIIRFKKYETDNFTKNVIERTTRPIFSFSKAQLRAFLALFFASLSQKGFRSISGCTFWRLFAHPGVLQHF